MWKRTTTMLLAALIAVPLMSFEAFARPSREGRNNREKRRREQPVDRGRRDDRNRRNGHDRRVGNNRRVEVNRVTHLIIKLRTGETWERRNAATELGSMAAHEAIPALSRALLSDRDAQVRRNAAHAFLRIGDRAALPALYKAANSDRNSRVRRECKISIKDILENPVPQRRRHAAVYTPPRRPGRRSETWKPSHPRVRGGVRIRPGVRIRVGW